MGGSFKLIGHKIVMEKNMQKLVKYVSGNKLGTFTLALSLTYIFIGLPSQIYIIWETGSVRGISSNVFVAGFAIILLGDVWFPAERFANDYCQYVLRGVRGGRYCTMYVSWISLKSFTKER